MPLDPRVCSTTSASGRIRCSSALRSSRASPSLRFRSRTGSTTAVPPRRMTARRRDTLIAQLGAKRPKTVEWPSCSWARARRLDSPGPIRQASKGDRIDMYAASADVPRPGRNKIVEFLVAGAEQLVDEASRAKADTFANDLSSRGCVVRDSRRAVGGNPGWTKRYRREPQVDSRVPKSASHVDHSNLPSRQRRALLDLVGNLDRPIDGPHAS